MAKNTLDPGQHRLGWIYDNDPATPHVAAMLVNTGSKIELTIPFGPPAMQAYERWFDSGAQWGDDPEREKFNYTPPQYLQFEDPDGPVALVHCTDVGQRSTFFSTGGGGHVSSQAPV